ncbi:MAG: CBS domain-containing protein [Saprospiraceae bacterium]
MTRELITVHPNDTMEKVRDIFEANSFHHLPVVDDEILVGVVSTKEVLKLTRNIGTKYDQKFNDHYLASVLVGDVMSKELVTLGPGDSIYTVIEKFNQGYFHSLPVVYEGKLVGMITSTDLTRFLYTQLKGERFLF